MIKTVSNQTTHQSQQHYPLQNTSFENQDFEVISEQINCKWVDGCGNNSYNIYPSTTPFLSEGHFQDININQAIHLNTSLGGAHSNVQQPLGLNVTIPNDQIIPQYQYNSNNSIQTAAVGFPLVNQPFAAQINQFNKFENNSYEDQKIMKQQTLNHGMIHQNQQQHQTPQRNGSGHKNEVSEMNQLQALRNLIQNMQTNNGANNQSSFITSPLNKPTNQINTVLSNNGISGLRAPQFQKIIPNVLDNQKAGNLSTNIVGNQSEHGVIPLHQSELYNFQCSLSSSNIPMQGSHTSQDVNCNSTSSNLQSSKLNHIPHSFHQLSSSISNSTANNTYVPFVPSSVSDQQDTSQEIYDKYQKCCINKQAGNIAITKTIDSVDVQKDKPHQSVNQEPTSFLAQLVNQQTFSSNIKEIQSSEKSSCVDINNQLKQLQRQLQQNSQTQQSSQLNNQSRNNTIKGVNCITNFQARNENQQELKKHMLRKLSDKNKEASQNSSNKNSPKSSQSSSDSKKFEKKRDIKVSTKKQNGYSSSDSSSDSSSKSSGKTSKQSSNTNQTQVRNTDQNVTAQNNQQNSLYDQIEGKNLKRNQTQMQSQSVPSGAQNGTKTKYQMVDHSTEQKKLRLNNGSFRQNDIFHTSGNRYVPTIPKSILGGSSTNCKNTKKI